MEDLRYGGPMQQANAFDCGMFAAAFVFEWACIPVTRLLQSANLDVLVLLVMFDRKYSVCCSSSLLADKNS